MRFKNVFIKSFGYELPPHVVTSEDIEERLTPLYQKLKIRKGQLEALTGICERRFWEPGYKMYEGALAAAKKAIEKSGVAMKDIGMLIFGGVCRDHLEPATACAVSDGLGLSSKASVYDISNACLGVINGMVDAANAIELGHIKAALVVSCETARTIVESTIERMIASRNMDTFKKTVATLTGGSGACAVLMTDGSLSDEARGDHRLLGAAIRNNNAHHRLCWWGNDPLAINGQIMETDSVGVLKNGVALGIDTFRALLKTMGWQQGKPDKIICHQVGVSHQNTILDAIGVSKDKDFTTFEYLGNMGTVSLPMTAAIADEREFLKPGEDVGFLGIGSGLNCIMLGIRW